MRTRILGIDPGYAIVGCGVVEYDGRNFTTLDYGPITTPAGMPFADRLAAAADLAMRGGVNADAQAQFQSLVSSMLVNESVYMTVNHYILPLVWNGRMMYSEMWVDPDADRDDSQPFGQEDGERTLRFLLKADIQSLGLFDIVVASRGNTVDVTLVDMSGNELEMPTAFDDFSGKADRDYSDVEEVPTEHALLLQNTMEKYGFEGYFGEWWHFQDEISYPVEDVFEPVTTERYYAQCNEFISLRTHPDTAAEVIVRIPKDDEFTVLALCGTFALAEYAGTWGYVHRDFIQPVAVG